MTTTIVLSAGPSCEAITVDLPPLAMAEVTVDIEQDADIDVELCAPEV